MDKDARTDFFISYTSADRSWAEWIAWHLEQENYTTAIQAWDIQAGSNFVLEMDNAAKTAEHTIAVLRGLADSVNEVLRADAPLSSSVALLPIG